MFCIKLYIAANLDALLDDQAESVELWRNDPAGLPEEMTAGLTDVRILVLCDLLLDEPDLSMVSGWYWRLDFPRQERGRFSQPQSGCIRDLERPA